MATQVNTTEHLLSRPQLAEVCNCSPMSIRRLELDPSSNFPQPIKLGGLVRWRWSDVQKFLAALKPASEQHERNATTVEYLVP